jgi:hypothetical protein
MMKKKEITEISKEDSIIIGFLKDDGMKAVIKDAIIHEILKRLKDVTFGATDLDVYVKLYKASM